MGDPFILLRSGPRGTQSGGTPSSLIFMWLLFGPIHNFCQSLMIARIILKQLLEVRFKLALIQKSKEGMKNRPLF